MESCNTVRPDLVDERSDLNYGGSPWAWPSLLYFLLGTKVPRK